MGYDWSFQFLVPYSSAFAAGALVTLVISISSFAAGTALGVPVGMLLRASPLPTVTLFVNDCIRAIPTLVLLFFVYYFPFTRMFGLRAPGPLTCAIIAMAIAQAAYTADLVRSAVDGVSPQLILGGRALGLTERTIWWHLILPDITRQMLPAEMAFFIGIVRLSSIASIIGAEEVAYVARIASSQSFRSLEAWLVVAFIYVVLVTPLTWLARWVEESQWLKRRF